MKNPFKNKVFRRWFWGVVIVIVLLLLFRVPTRLSVAAFNRQTNLPFGLLEKGADFSAFTRQGGFGMVSYERQDDTGSLRYDVSRWPDILFGKRQTTDIRCSDPDFTICGISVGDNAFEAAEILEHHGFLKWNMEESTIYKRFGLSIKFYTDKKNQTVTDIIVFVNSTSILPVVF